MLKSRRENIVPHGCRHGHFEWEKLLHSAAALGFEGVAIKVICSC